MKNDIYKDYELDEDDDIILPDTIWGELVYIKFILADMLKNPESFKDEFIKLKRQIYFFVLWMKNR